jgi:hypothetical protein
MKEKTGRRFWRGGGELFGTGEEGGLDRGTSSDQIPDEVFGLEVEASGTSRAEVVRLEGEEVARFVGTPISLMGVCSTRLRLVGGSSS